MIEGSSQEDMTLNHRWRELEEKTLKGALWTWMAYTTITHLAIKKTQNTTTEHIPGARHRAGPWENQNELDKPPPVTPTLQLTQPSAKP